MHNRLLGENQQFLGEYRRFPVIAPLKTAINHLILKSSETKPKFGNLEIHSHHMMSVSIKLSLNKYNYSDLYAVFSGFMHESCVFHLKILHFFQYFLIFPRTRGGEGVKTVKVFP